MAGCTCRMPQASTGNRRNPPRVSQRKQEQQQAGSSLTGTGFKIGTTGHRKNGREASERQKKMAQPIFPAAAAAPAHEWHQGRKITETWPTFKKGQAASKSDSGNQSIPGRRQQRRRSKLWGEDAYSDGDEEDSVTAGRSRSASPVKGGMSKSASAPRLGGSASKVLQRRLLRLPAPAPQLSHPQGIPPIRMWRSHCKLRIYWEHLPSPLPLPQASKKGAVASRSRRSLLSAPAAAPREEKVRAYLPPH